MNDIEFSDNVYDLMEQVGVTEDEVREVVNNQEHTVLKDIPDDPIKVVEAPVDGHTVRVVYSTKPKDFGAGYGGDAVVISTNVSD